MLKKKQRLTTAEFNRFFSSGQRFHSPLFTLVWHPHSTFHAAAVAGKKVYKRAVDRNRLRRRLYNILYRLSRENGLEGVYIVIAKPNAASANFNELKAELVKLVNQTLNPKP